MKNFYGDFLKQTFEHFPIGTLRELPKYSLQEFIKKIFLQILVRYVYLKYGLNESLQENLNEHFKKFFNEFLKQFQKKSLRIPETWMNSIIARILQELVDDPRYLA